MLTSDIIFSTKRTHSIVAIGFIALFAFFALLDVGKQSLVDEPLWLFDRVERYWYNLYNGNFDSMRPSDKPGVTVSILGAPGLLVETRPSLIKDDISPTKYEELATWMRVPIIIFLTLSLWLFYVFTRKLMGDSIALVTIMFTSLSPILIGMSRIVNPDALLWLYLPLTILAYFWHLNSFRSHTKDKSTIAELVENQSHKEKDVTKHPRKKILKANITSILICGALFGFCLLTKYVSTILFVFLPIILFLHTIFSSHETVRQHLEKLQGKFITLISIFSVAIFTYMIFLPSVWTKPHHILEGTFFSQAFAPIAYPYFLAIGLVFIDLYILPRFFSFSIGAHSTAWLSRKTSSLIAIVGMLWVTCFSYIYYVAISASDLTPFHIALRSPKDAGNNVGFITTFFTDFYILFFTVSIIIIVGSLVTFLHLTKAFLTKDKVAQAISSNWIIIAILLFIPLYYAGSAISGVTTILRYQVALFPLLFIVSAWGTVRLLSFFPHILSKIFFFLIAVYFIFVLISLKPYYFSYVNEVLPKAQLMNIKDMGDGSYQAAQYLNSLPNANSLSIWSDKSGVCATFIGECTTTVNVERIANEKITFDYYVISRSRKYITERDAQFKRRSSRAPNTTYHFDYLYRETVPNRLEIDLGMRESNYIRVISAEDTNIFIANDQR